MTWLAHVSTLLVGAWALLVLRDICASLLPTPPPKGPTMGFDAGTVVSPLEYNFDSLAKRYTKPDGESMYPELVGVSGTTPEPSDEMVQEMQRSFVAATTRLNSATGAVDAEDRKAVAAALEAIPKEEFAKVEEDILDALAKLCQGRPTRDQLAALPYRQKREYIKWLQNELMNPES